MEAVGLPKLVGTETHHIIAVNSQHAAPARRILEQAGLIAAGDKGFINSAFNGVHLPEAIHHKIHTKYYYEVVNKRLEAVAKITAPNKLQEAILKELAEIRNLLIINPEKFIKNP